MTIPAVQNLAECFDSMRHLLHELDESEWSVPSLCPGWEVRDVVAHLTGFEAMLAGWPPGVESPQLFERMVPYMAEARAWSPAELLDRFDAAVAARRSELGELEEDDFEARCWTPVGEQSYGRFVGIRVFDFWVHEQDIRVPLGRPGHLDGPAALMALDEVRGSFGYIAGKKVGVPDGRSVTVRLTGPLVDEISASVVDGRARVVAGVTNPDASITTDSLTFLLLACGRIDPAAPLADGRVTLGGDQELAHRLATQLRFTI